MRRVFPVSVLLGFLNVGVADAQAAPSFDICGLVPKATIDGIMGGATSEARPRPDSLAYGTVQTFKCRYKGKEWNVETHVEEGRDKEGIEMYMKTLKGVVKQTTASDAKAISGIGDEAWWGPINPTSGILSVRLGTDLVWVKTYGKETGAGSLEKTRAVTEKLLASYKTARKR